METFAYDGRLLSGCAECRGKERNEDDDRVAFKSERTYANLQTSKIAFQTYPCPHCAEDFRVDIKQHPVELADREKFARWMCEMHNRVNVKLGKNVFDCSKVQERWYDGWKDGSCDF